MSKQVPAFSSPRTALRVLMIPGLIFLASAISRPVLSQAARVPMFDSTPTVTFSPSLFDPGGHIATVRSVAFSPDGKQILTGSNDYTARLWDAATGKSIRTFFGHTTNVTSVAFSPDGKEVLTGSDDYTA